MKAFLNKQETVRKRKLKRWPRTNKKMITQLAVIEEEVSEFEMNSEQDELELFMLEMIQKDK